MITNLLEKLETIPAAGNNGYARFDCMRPVQVRRLNQFKAELEARGNVVFSTTGVYTSEAYAIARAYTDSKAAQAAAARRAEQEKEDLSRRADFALNAMLARAEAMTMTA